MLIRIPSMHSVKEPVLVEPSGIPRFWPSVWQAMNSTGLAESTVLKNLGNLENFYRYVEATIGAASLDDALASCDLDPLFDVLEGYFFALKNRPPITAATEDKWQAAVQFVIDTAHRTGRAHRGAEQIHDLEARIHQFRLMSGRLYAGRRRRAERIRSLPAEVVEWLYMALDPGSPHNPFKGIRSRWRVFTIFVLLLNQGLRRGELLVLPTDGIKNGIDRNTQKPRHWMSVKFNEYEDDPRSAPASIKNAFSVRQIPVSGFTATIVEEYVLNHRGRPNHSFLIGSQKNLPLSTRRLSQMFNQISAALPGSLRKVMMDHCGQCSISPHDLRHTSAVVRLNQLLTAGVEMQDATERLRVLFGWSRDSDMPLRYARCVFEDRLASFWNSNFDDQVEVLRSIPVRSA